MGSYELKFVVESDCLTDQVIDNLGESQDVVCGQTGYGDGFVIITAEAESARAAIRSACTLLQVDFGIRIIELQRDLVGMAEIAARTKQTRQSVHHWISGKRRGGEFPRPFDPTNSLWLWSEVRDWAVGQGIETDDPGMSYPSRSDHDWASVAISSGWSQAVVDGHAGAFNAPAPELGAWLRQRSARHGAMRGRHMAWHDRISVEGLVSRRGVGQ